MRERRTVPAQLGDRAASISTSSTSNDHRPHVLHHLKFTPSKKKTDNIIFHSMLPFFYDPLPPSPGGERRERRGARDPPRPPPYAPWRFWYSSSAKRANPFMSVSRISPTRPSKAVAMGSSASGTSYSILSFTWHRSGPLGYSMTSPRFLTFKPGTPTPRRAALHAAPLDLAVALGGHDGKVAGRPRELEVPPERFAPQHPPAQARVRGVHVHGGDPGHPLGDALAALPQLEGEVQGRRDLGRLGR